MADISKITVGGVTYDVKDETARKTSVYIGPEQPTDGTMYWLDTSVDEPDVPVVPDEPDVPDDPEVTLTSISAAYSGGDVAVGTALTDLTGIVVTATYSDGSTATVTGYTLSGEIAEGSNTITVTYEGMTATFTVTGIAEEEPNEPESGIFKLDDIAVEITENQQANGTASTGTYKRYKVENIKSGDIIRLAGFNGDTNSGWYDGTSAYKLNDTTMFTKAFMDNYAWCQYTWTADADYPYLYFASMTSKLETNPTSVATLERVAS